jgi:hypothetical protein
MYAADGQLQEINFIIEIKTTIIASFATTSSRVYVTQVTSLPIIVVFICDIHATGCTHPQLSL